MRVVLDANVLVSALIVKQGKPAQILRQVGTFELITSQEILAETERVLHYERIQKRYQLSDEDINTYVQHLREVSKIVLIKTQIEVIKEDPDDDKFLACALDAGADYIISGNSHLTGLGKYQGIPILTPAEFLEVMSTTDT